MNTDIPGVLFIDHIAIAVKPGDMDAQIKTYQTLGFNEVHREEVYGKDQVREVLLRVGDSNNLIQLLEPLTPDSPVAKTMEKSGGRGGFAHIAYRVANVQMTFDFMKSEGYQLLDTAPRPGSRGTTIFFAHPKTHSNAAFGYLMEFVESKS